MSDRFQFEWNINHANGGIDPAGGDQPLYAGAACLVANGEVYNYRELREALPGTQFPVEAYGNFLRQIVPRFTR